MPTIVLVPVETDFSHPMDPATSINEGDMNGASIGTLVRLSPSVRRSQAAATDDAIAAIWTCEDHPEQPGCEPPAPPPPLPPGPAGVYFKSLTLRDLGESWSRGEPEIEVHIFGTEVGYYVPVKLWSDVWGVGATAASREVWMDCAGETADGYRYFDFDHLGTTSVYPNYQRDALFASTKNFAIVEEVSHDHLLLLKRRVQLQPPFHIKILERDDGKSCPAPPKKYDPTFGIELTVIPFDWSSIEPWHTSNLMEMLNHLLGGGNENLADWTNVDFTTLESGSTLTLTGGGAADISIKSEGFSHFLIPANQNPYP